MATSPHTNARILTVLLVSVDNPNRPYVPLAAAGLREALRERAIDVTLYAECFDQVRFGDRPSYLMEYRRWLWQKYTDRHLDALVVRDQALLKLFADAPDNPWRGIPIIYVTLGHLTIDTTRAHPSASGVVMENHFPLLISTIKTLLPGTRRIGTIRGASKAERTRDSFRSAPTSGSGAQLGHYGQGRPVLRNLPPLRTGQAVLRQILETA